MSSNDQETAPSMLSNILGGKTAGVQGIEAAYKRAGGTANHTPGHGSAVDSDGEKMKGGQGVGSKQFSENFQDQRQEPSAIGKMFNNMINGTDNTK